MVFMTVDSNVESDPHNKPHYSRVHLGAVEAYTPLPSGLLRGLVRETRTARLCFVVVGATDIPWQVIEFIDLYGDLSLS
jgi:hypothetical protein